MRKLKLQMQQSIDGFVGGPKGELDFMEWNWDDSLKDYVNQLHVPVDLIVMGKNLAQGFIPYWEKVASDPKDPQVEFGKKMHETQKLFFSRTLKESPAEWKNTSIARSPVEKEIPELKSRAGGDIIVYGGVQYVSSLLDAGLIDELYLFVNPSAIGRGLSIFSKLEQKMSFKLVEGKVFDCGIVLQIYQPK